MYLQNIDNNIFYIKQGVLVAPARIYRVSEALVTKATERSRGRWVTLGTWTMTPDLT